jgi:CheY-like chemotaxis protein
VVGDAARLRQVLLNLAGNAIKFTSTGGVALIVEPGIGPNEISFLVRDTGIGIAPEAQARIFREFEQADERIARSYGGTGLGLSISERIVKRMGGRINLDSKPGAGSTFEVSVPLAASDGNGSEQKVFAAPDLSGQSIMVVAPQRIEASLIARRLQRWGGQTCTISDIAVAQALLPERAWHAVLLDHALGAEDVELLAEAARPHAMQRIVLVTPAARHELRPSSGSPAFTGYLIKPLRAASLAARLTMAPEVLAPSLAGDPPIEGPDDVGTPAAAPLQGLSILVAEDNEINALLIRSLLTRLGHHAVIATNGEAALESWLAAKSAGTPYDLVLMDIQMPPLDGIETTRRIRSLEAGQPGRQTPILALTANTLVEDRYACFEAGMDGFLIKPLDREKLAAALAGLAASRHIAAESPNNFSVVPAKAATHHHKCVYLRKLSPPLSVTINIGGYGSPLSRGRRRKLQPPQRHGLDHMVRALFQDQRRARSGRQNILLEIGEVGPLPDRERGRGRFLVGKRSIAMKVRSGIVERGVPQRQETPDVPFAQHSFVGIDVDGKIEEIRHHRNGLAVAWQPAGLQDIDALENQDIRPVDLDPFVRNDVVGQMRIDRRAHRPPSRLDVA